MNGSHCLIMLQMEHLYRAQMTPSKSHSELCAEEYESLLQAIHQQTAVPSRQRTPGATRTPGRATAATQTLSHLSSTLLRLEVRRTL